MAGHQARILTPAQLNVAMRHVRGHGNPIRSRVLILLSLKAGLRAGEIAKLEWPMILNPVGRISDSIAVENRIAKKGSGRRIPIHPDLRKALVDLYRQSNDLEGPVIRSARDAAMKPNSIVNWFGALYAALGFDGCSSHSGRRTFITTAARLTHKAGGSLRDVQLLAGHRSIETTQGYIDGDSAAQRKLVSLL